MSDESGPQGRVPFWHLGVVVAVAFALPSTLLAQRHGRADSAQNYAKGIPEPALKITVDGQSKEWKRDAFAALPRESATVVGPKSRVFRGVTLSQLLPVGSNAIDSDTSYEIHHGFFHTRRIAASDLQRGTDVLIADQRDQKTIAKPDLFYLIAIGADSKPITIGKVTSIVIHNVQR